MPTLDLFLHFLAGRRNKQFPAYLVARVKRGTLETRLNFIA